MAAGRCAVVGAGNIDIGGFPREAVVPGDSIPGRVALSAGGVGRNIACNAARLALETHLVAAFGTDPFADILRRDLSRAGVHTDLCLTFEGARSSCYLYVTDPRGEMLAAVNDMDLCLRMTPEALSGRMDALDAMDLVVLDANLPSDTLLSLAGRLHPPLIADAVSAVKAHRLRPILPRLQAIKVNALEARALTGIDAGCPKGAAAAARALVAMGTKQVYLTLGSAGACCADERGTWLLPCPATRTVNVTGAGDAFAAALVWAHLSGLDTPNTALAGLAAAALTVEAPGTVAPGLSPAALTERIAAMSPAPSSKEEESREQTS
ncbi:MAG: bifunctional hydroxymethylpyrimidine kinase/phosphomethylpyrimidine kinase [Clostridia bacterium]|nr:bifunctional hydroxymethylpyrimidine kinase/phosphomethylpyrimidine kinase [Clostridia bacterium]